ncbi:MAG TPA: 3-phosphoglycerate dehydrogenase family protein [Vicinamibacterales bacterium]|nr:3-phosphoglycerate dehydrogenase family protein [Vicinamibacterales bacterium]
MKVLVADKFEQTGIDGLRAAGCEVLYEPDLKEEPLQRAIAASGARVLIVRSTQVTAPMLDGSALSLIVRAGAGVNTIDVAAASERGIYVSNCPGKNAIAVAELTFALLLAIDRRIPENVSELRACNWNKKEFSKAQGLYGRTIGVLGFGSIGQEVARRARGFGMPVLVWSRRFGERPESREAAAQEFGISVVDDPRELVARAEIISIHLALTKETRGFVGADLLAHVREGAILINTARAEVVDYEALAAAVRERRLRVGLDVFANEPAAPAGTIDDPILALPGVYGTHHIGASTDQAQDAIAAEAVRIVRTFKETGRVPNVVNLSRQSPATHMLVVRHRDKPGVLAHVFQWLRDAGLNVQETENIIFEGAHAAVARINLDREPPRPTLDRIETGHPDVLDLQLVRLT